MLTLRATGRSCAASPKHVVSTRSVSGTGRGSGQCPSQRPLLIRRLAVDGVPVRAARGEAFPGEGQRRLAPDLPGRVHFRGAKPGPAWTKLQVPRVGQVDSRTALPGESASSAYMVAFAAARNWLFHAPLRPSVRRLDPEDVGVRFCDHVLAEQRERRPAAQGPGEGGLARCGEAVHENDQSPGDSTRRHQVAHVRFRRAS
jgi:hypothetical protein